MWSHVGIRDENSIEVEGWFESRCGREGAVVGDFH